MIHYYSSRNYMLTLLCAVLGLCGWWWYVRRLIRKNIYWFSADQKSFISRYASYGSFIILSIVLFLCLRFFFVLTQSRDVMMVVIVWIAWIIGLAGIFHTQKPLFSLSTELYGLYFTCVIMPSKKIVTLCKYLIQHSIFPFVLLLFSVPLVSANVSLSLTGMQLIGWETVYQWTTPTVSVQIVNNGSDPAVINTNTLPLATWFITCRVWTLTVFASDPITSLTINPQSLVEFPLILSADASQNLGDQNLLCRLGTYSWWTILSPSQSLALYVESMPQWRFDAVLGRVTEPISDKLDDAVPELGLGGIRSWFFSLIDNLIVPGMTILGIFFALLLLYRTMFSQDKDALKGLKWIVLRPIVWFILIFTARFAGYTLYDITHQGTIGQGEFSLVEIVSQSYDTLIFPFLKIGFYLMMAVLFIILLIRAFSFVTGSDEEVRKKAWTTIIWLTVWLLLVIGSKQLVEWVYGKEEQVRNAAALNVSDIGSAFLSTKNIPIIYDVIQRVVWLAWFIVLVMIIFQTFKLLVDPTNEDNIKSIGKTLLYVVIGMLVLGAGYLLVNVVMLN